MARVNPQERVQRRTAEQIVGMRFAMQHQVPVVPEAEKCRDDDEANKTKIEAKSAEEYRDENEANKAMNETTIAEKYRDVDETNKKKIEVESIGDYRDEDEANRVMIETRNGSENYCVTARNTSVSKSSRTSLMLETRRTLCRMPWAGWTQIMWQRKTSLEIRRTPHRMFWIGGARIVRQRKTSLKLETSRKLHRMLWTV